MKQPPIYDADDRRQLAQGVILYVLAVVAFLGGAATLGLAWLVFRLAGGL